MVAAQKLHAKTSQTEYRMQMEFLHVPVQISVDNYFCHLGLSTILGL